MDSGNEWERTALLGKKTELFRNELDWEGRLIEGASFIKHNNYYYAFYSAAGCCGRKCTYKTGVARSQSLFGPWEKDISNPILVDEENWKCQGHGTPIKVGDTFYFLYHGYSAETGVFTGRQGLLRQFEFTADNWVTFTQNFIESDLPKKDETGQMLFFKDDFIGSTLKPSWNWSVDNKPNISFSGESLIVKSDDKLSTSFLIQKIYTKNYSAILKIQTEKSTAWSGITLIGDEQKYLSAMVKNDSIKVVAVNKKDISEGDLTKLEMPTEAIYLKIEVSNNFEVTFLYSVDNENYVILNEKSLDANYLPPWDRAVRVGLVSSGNSGERSYFDSFQLFTEE